MEPRSDEAQGMALLADRQMRFKEVLHKVAETPAAPSKPKVRFITVSRMIGSHGDAVAAQLARQLGWHVFDREIVDHIAQDSHVRQSLVEQLDEHSQNLIHDTVRRFLTMAEGTSFGIEEYHRALVKTLAYLATSGNAILVGRGANFALRGQEHGLHIRTIASHEVRIRRLAQRWGTTVENAKLLMAEVDRERHGFVRHHFNQDPEDPGFYDLVFSTDNVAPGEVVSAILGVVLPKESASQPCLPKEMR